MTTRTLVDLFAGCGGLSLGLEMAGFTPVLVNEISPDAMTTYIMNRPKYPNIMKVNDVKELFYNDETLLDNVTETLHATYTDIDLVVGGPPCQGFSGMGYRRLYSVEKKNIPSNHLYQDMARIIHKIRPKAFIFENVKGLLSARWEDGGEKGEIWEDVLRTFKCISDYTVRSALVHAKDYGIPQNRPRVILVGLRYDQNIPFNENARANGFIPEGTREAPDLIDVLSDLVDPGYISGGKTLTYSHSPKNNLQEWFRTDIQGDISVVGDTLTEQEYARHGENVQNKFKIMLENNGVLPEELRTKKFSQRLLPERWGEKGPSITVTGTPQDYVHFSQPRSLTVREWARLQTFPDWYQFSGRRDTGGLARAGNPREGIYTREIPKYTQIGNAVPVLMAKKIGKHLKTLLKEE